MIHHSNNCCKVKSTHNGHAQMGKCDVESIVSALRVFLLHNKSYVRNLVSIGNDNSSVMVGINNDVYTK